MNNTNIIDNSSTIANSTGTGNISQYPAEWVYPNSSEGKYITGTQVRMYIGDLFIDELDSIQIVYYANSVPIYGYSSRRPDAFGHGRSIVQGQIKLNFISEGYLFTVINEAKNFGQVLNNTNSNVQQVANLAQQSSSLQSGNTSSVVTTNQINQVNNQLISAASGLTPDQMDQVKNIMKSSTLTSPTNAVNYKVPFTIRMNSTAGGRTIKRQIRDCVLVSNEQIIDQSGDVIADTYGFIARDFT